MSHFQASPGSPTALGISSAPPNASTPGTSPSTSGVVNPRPSDDPNDLFKRAIHKFEKDSGQILSKMPFYTDVMKCDSAEAVIKVLEKHELALKASRAIGGSLRKVLAPIVRILSLFLDASAEAASSLGVPGGKAIFVAFGVFLQAADGVTRAYDGMKTLLERLSESLTEIDTFAQSSLTSAMQEALVAILVHLLNILALLIPYCRAEKERKSRRLVGVFTRRAEDYFKVLLNNNDDVKNALGKLKDLTDRVNRLSQAEIHAKTTRIEKAVLHDKQDLKKWLNSPDPFSNRVEKRKQKSDNTGKWFFDDVFKPWKETDKRLFLLSGNAGSGKSVLLSSVLEALDIGENVPDSNGDIVLYFFFDFRVSTKQESERLLSSLLHQLCDQCDESLAVIKKWHSDPRNEKLHSDEKLLRGCLKEALHASQMTIKRNIFIFIDALDECSQRSQPDSSGLFFCLTELVCSERVHVRLFVTARPEPDIMTWFKALEPGNSTAHLDLTKHEGHDSDIATYLLHELALPDFNDWLSVEKSDVRKGLLEQGNGMFLWVTLQLNELRRSASSDERRRIMRELPDDLDGTYSRILTNFSKSSKAKITRVAHFFQCIAFALRPLSIEEADGLFQVKWHEHPNPYFAFDSPADTKTLSDHDRESKLRLVCPGLLDFVDGERGRIVRFIHPSVKEYFLSDTLRKAAAPLPSYAFTEDSAQVTLARVCLSSVRLNTGTRTAVNRPTLSSRSPRGLYNYALNCWFKHVPTVGIPTELEELLGDFLHPGSKPFKTWLYDYRASHLSKGKEEWIWNASAANIDLGNTALH